MRTECELVNHWLGVSSLEIQLKDMLLKASRRVIDEAESLAKELPDIVAAGLPTSSTHAVEESARRRLKMRNDWSMADITPSVNESFLFTYEMWDLGLDDGMRFTSLSLGDIKSLLEEVIDSTSLERACKAEEKALSALATAERICNEAARKVICHYACYCVCLDDKLWVVRSLGWKEDTPYMKLHANDDSPTTISLPLDFALKLLAGAVND